MADPDIFKLQGVLDPYGKLPNPLTRQPYSANYTKFATERPGWINMPTFTTRYQFFKLLNDNQIVISIAGTGTGKTVVIPRLVNHFFGYKKGVFVLNPKVSQCIETSRTAATFSDVELGAEVGHVYPLDARVETVKDNEHEDFSDVVDTNNKAYSRDRTKLIFCSDRWMQAFMKGKPDNNGYGGPNLSGYGGVLMDEIHGRSIGQDYLLALFCDLAKSRPDFRIVLMSATLEPEPFMEYFKRIGISAAVWNLPTKTTFHIERIFSKTDTKMNKIMNNLEPTIREVLKKHPEGNIIVFVHSVKAAIQKIKKSLEEDSHTFSPRPVFFLFGSEYQNETKPYIASDGDKDFRNYMPDDGKGAYGRMVIFSTTVGQEGITFKDLRYVIDTGLEQRVAYDPKHYAIMQGKIFVARSNINQRCGRTGRTIEGMCEALYSKAQYDSFEEQQAPEISRSDLTENYLEIITHPNYGTYSKAEQFFNIMITPPSHTAKFQAMRSLVSHNLVDGNSGLPTQLGFLASLSKKIDYKLCKMLIAGIFFTTNEFDCLTPVLYICAILNVVGKDGIMGLFKSLDKNNPKYNELSQRQKALLAHFTIPRSDHLTAYMIYATSRNSDIFLENPYNGTNVNFKIRRAWCEDFMLEHKRIQDIDLAVFEIKQKFLNKYTNELLNLDVLRITDGKYYQRNLQYQYGGSTSIISKYGSKDNTKNTKNTKKNIVKSKIQNKSKPSTTKSIKNKMMNLMDNITFFNKPIPILSSFKSPNHNILACIFFGSVNNIGIIENMDKGTYLIKYSNNDIGIPSKTSILYELGKSSPLIMMYNNFVLNYEMPNAPGELTFVSELPISIIKAFGININ